MKLKIQEIISSVFYKNIKDTGFKYPIVVIKDKRKYSILLTDNRPPRTYTIFTAYQIPKIQNYASYNPTSTSSLSVSVGCASKFNSPSYVFPSWDADISTYTAGFTFGVIKIKDFLTLTSETITDPNNSLTC